VGSPAGPQSFQASGDGAAQKNATIASIASKIDRNEKLIAQGGLFERETGRLNKFTSDCRNLRGM